MADQIVDVRSTIPSRLMQEAINKQVANRMGALARELKEFTKGMSPEETQEAGLLLLGMMETSFALFLEKTRERIERSPSKKK